MQSRSRLGGLVDVDASLQEQPATNTHGPRQGSTEATLISVDTLVTKLQPVTKVCAVFSLTRMLHA